MEWQFGVGVRFPATSGGLVEAQSATLLEGGGLRLRPIRLRSRLDPGCRARVYCRYCWIRVVRRPARPWRSIEYCQARNSSTVSV
jgi:hypothetical protein